ncbi:uncharacterized protein B0H64DRAFT_104042 [Chaetomium fimeti]|uniref:PD-(D/E)XK nuclease-like domain-containing protein n=1 Tax=Chaetomium fimeti TaxID=1854472 RepID=A0AAE0LW33_9PEZI|nr:hypothetical protein B0H64DRAFT_104042 [Chaetomium fimeti]
MLSQGVFPTEIRDEIERPNRKMAPGIFRGAEHRARDSGQERLGERSGQDAAHDVFIDFPAVWALPRAVSHSSTTPARLARAEFHHVRNLEVDARKCLALHRSEASWNCNVHKPLLDLALWKYCDSIALENATSARILPAFIPALVTGEAIRGKMVDFVLSPNFTAAGRTASQSSHISNATIDAAILKRLAMQPSAGSRNLGVNHTDYPPLLRAPTAVTIATMIGSGSLEDGRVRLGIWTAAWHIRMAALGISGWEDGPLLPTLPLILTHEHQWSLYFAVDRGHKIEILGGIQIGTTSTTQGIYQLLAVLRLLADWIETEFKEWVVTAFTEDTS